MYEIREHTADLGVHVAAATLADLLADAARGVTAVIAGDATQIRPATTETFTVPGGDPAWLLCDWVAEVLAAFDLRRMLFCDLHVAVDAAGLRATARGERYDPARHVLAHEVKAVTQHELDVHPTPAGWEGFFILDV
ncbi:MAG: archease [Planctomycetaceae bacterium]